jgi:hypothetical protein
VRSWPDLLDLATHDPRTGLQRMQKRPFGAGEFSHRAATAFFKALTGLSGPLDIAWSGPVIPVGGTQDGRGVQAYAVFPVPVVITAVANDGWDACSGDEVEHVIIHGAQDRTRVRRNHTASFSRR